MGSTNSSPLSPVPPEMTVFPKHRVELEDPNVLICYVDKFWPPIISITWLRNGEEVQDGVTETIFYRGQDNCFRKFSYLTFVPTRGDYYDCRVEHEGLPSALLKHWGEHGGWARTPGSPPLAGSDGGSAPTLTPPQSLSCPSPPPRAPRPWCAPWAWPWASSALSWAPSSSSRP